MKGLGSLIIFLCIFNPGSAQDQNNMPAHVSIYGALSYPSEEFKNAVDNSIGGIGAGLSTTILLNPKGNNGFSPVYVGVDFTYLTFGRDKIEATNSAPPYKTSFNHYGISGLGRLFFKEELGFFPFIDGLIGVKVFNTRTKIDKDVFDHLLTDDQAEVVDNTNDAGLGFGAGLGFFIKNYPPADDEYNSGGGSITMRIVYLWGAPTTYVKRGSMEIENGYITYEKGYARTDMILLNIGFCFY